MCGAVGDTPLEDIGALLAEAERLTKEVDRLERIEKVARRIAKTIPLDVSAGGPSGSGAFVSKAMARDLLAALSRPKTP